MEENKEVEIEQVSVDDVTDVAADAPAPENDAPADDVDPSAQIIAELNDKYLRIAAELENTRRRAALDAESSARARAMGVARNFLPVMDAIDAALQHNPDDAGIVAMARAMDAALTAAGITKIAAVGEQLNPTLHNAIQVMPAPADMNPAPAPNTVLSEMQAGYMFGDAVLRPAMVVVSK